MTLSIFRPILFLFLFFTSPMFGQERIASTQDQLYFKSFTSADGLPSQKTHNTFQDRLGFLWISTDEGLTKYDGYKFTPYYDESKGNIRLKGACGFYEDERGRLWVINGSGYFHYYDRIKDVFVAISSPLEDGWREPSAHTILKDEAGKMIISSHGGIVSYDPENEEISHVDIEAVRAPESWPHQEKVRFGPMYLEEGKALWLGTRKFGFVKYDLELDTTTFYRFHPAYNRQLLDDWITDIVAIDTSTLLIADHANGLVLWDLDKEEVKEVFTNKDLLDTDRDIGLTDIHSIGNGRYWLASDGFGLLLFNLKTKQLEQHYSDEGNEDLSVSDNRITHVSQDRNGTFWIGTNTLQQATSELYDFVDLTSDIEDDRSLPDNDVFWMSKLLSGDIIVSTSSGACILDIETNSFTFPISEKLKTGNTYGVADGKGNTCWIGQYDQLQQVELSTGNILKSYAREIVVDEQNNILRRACRVMEDVRQKVWAIDHWGRLKYIDPESDSVTNVYELAQDIESGKFVNCLTMLDDPEHEQIIVGMDYGLAVVAYQDQKATKLNLSFEGIDLSKAACSYLYRDLQSNIWVIIEGNTYKLDIKKKSLELLNLNEEYGVGSFRWIIEEPKHSYWLSSFKGVIRYDEQSGTSSSYYTPNIGGSSFADPSPVVASEGKVYFSGYEGITILDPSVVQPESRSPKVLISHLTVNKEPLILDATISEKKRIKLRYMFNDLVFSLSNFSFVNQENSQYRYKLSPRDDEWVDNGNDHTLELFNLPPDDYVLELKSSNSDGIWSEEITRLEIVITPPWWKTLWARMLFLLGGLGAVLYVQYYLYQQKLKKKTELEDLRSKISSDLHDDVGTVLTGIAMQSELLENFADEGTKHIANQIASNSRIAMGKMRDTVWAMDARKDNMGDLKDRMLDFVEDTLIPRDILTEFESNLDNSIKLRPNVRQAVYLIYKESIVNIAKHSNTDKVKVKLDIRSGRILLGICDFGSSVGKIKTSGQGIQNMKERAERLNGSFSFDFKDGYQTEVSIPLDV